MWVFSGSLVLSNSLSPFQWLYWLYSPSTRSCLLFYLTIPFEIFLKESIDIFDKLFLIRSGLIYLNWTLMIFILFTGSICRAFSASLSKTKTPLKECLIQIFHVHCFGQLVLISFRFFLLIYEKQTSSITRKLEKGAISVCVSMGSFWLIFRTSI